MSNMFRDAQAFTGDIGNFNMTQVTSLSHFLNGALSWNRPISNWNSTKVQDMSSMVRNICGSIFVNLRCPFYCSNVLSLLLPVLQPIEMAIMRAVCQPSLLQSRCVWSQDLLRRLHERNVLQCVQLYWRRTGYFSNRHCAGYEGHVRTAVSSRRREESYFSGILCLKILSAVLQLTFFIITFAHILFRFSRCYSLESPDLSGWDVSSVANMRGMFSYCYAFNTQSLANWNTASLVDAGYIFVYNEAFNGSLENWNVEKVITMESMMMGTAVFNQNTFGNWNTKSVLDMSSLFRDAVIFNQPVPFDTSSVVTMKSMFDGCHAFNQNLTSFTPTKVKDMSYMFRDAFMFNGNVSSFATPSLTTMNSKF